MGFPRLFGPPVLVTAMSTLFVLPTTGLGQTFRPDEYYRYIPDVPSIVRQTDASRAMGLFGDVENGSDVAPADGIEDRRGERLLSLAARFSPILHAGNFSLPRDFEEVLGYHYDPETDRVSCDGRAILHVDTWVREPPQVQLVDSLPLDLGVIREPSVCPGIPTQPSTSMDAAFSTLVRRLAPTTSRFRQRDASKDLDTVLYFDFPGTGEKSWRAIYDTPLKGMASRIYAHPFIYEHATARTERRYEFVIQYWFFYPFNDGANNHEGDWEHLNVSIAPRDHMVNADAEHRLLSESDVKRIIGAQDPMPLRDLVLSAVDYYFHHFSVTVDYKPVHEGFCGDRPVVYNSAIQLRFGYLSSSRSRDAARYRCDVLRERLANAHSILQTHPIAYIGADNIGPDQLIAAIGTRNQNSHGTYPFRGLWKQIGPAGATERVSGRRWPRIDARRSDLRWLGPDLRQQLAKDKFHGYDEENITLLPDWERVADLVKTDPSFRRNWSWLLLPIRWGFPTTNSPGAGLFERTDLGHVAPVGPAYNDGWNRVNAEGGYQHYEATPLYAGFQLSPWDNFRNSWGPLNASFPLILGLPIVNLVPFLGYPLVSLVPGLVSDKFFLPGPRPDRLFEVHFGPARQWGGGGFAQALPQGENDQIADILLGAPGSTVQDFVRQSSWVWKASYIFQYNRRFANETIVMHVPRLFNGARLGYSIVQAADVDGTVGDSVARVDGVLRATAVHGVIRYNTRYPFEGVLEFVLRGGYGWTWYEINDITITDASGVSTLVGEMARGGRSPLQSKFPAIVTAPNTGLLGGGLEFLIPASLGTVRAGLRADWTMYHTAGAGGRTELWLVAFIGI